METVEKKGDKRMRYYRTMQHAGQKRKEKRERQGQKETNGKNGKEEAMQEVRCKRLAAQVVVEIVRTVNKRKKSLQL